MAEKQDLDVKIADTLCKVHRYLMEEGRGESAGWAEGDGPPRFQDDEEV